MIGASTYGGLAKGDTAEYAKQYKAQRRRHQTRHELIKALPTEQGLETELKQLNLDKLTRESEIVKELRGLDMSKPESAGRRKELFEEYALLNGKSLMGASPRYATGKMLEAAVAAESTLARAWTNGAKRIGTKVFPRDTVSSPPGRQIARESILIPNFPTHGPVHRGTTTQPPTKAQFLLLPI